MIVKEGQNGIMMPELFEPDTVTMVAYSGGVQQRGEPGYALCMFRVDWRDLQMLPSSTRSLRGLPDRFAMSPDHRTIAFHPVSDRERDIWVRYCPAMKEI